MSEINVISNVIATDLDSNTIDNAAKSMVTQVIFTVQYNSNYYSRQLKSLLRK